MRSTTAQHNTTLEDTQMLYRINANIIIMGLMSAAAFIACTIRIMEGC